MSPALWLGAFKSPAKTFREHFQVIINAYKQGISNAAAESINSQI